MFFTRFSRFVALACWVSLRLLNVNARPTPERALALSDAAGNDVVTVDVGHAPLTALGDKEVSQGEIAARNLVDQDEDDSDNDDLRGRDGIKTGLARRRHGSHGQP